MSENETPKAKENENPATDKSGSAKDKLITSLNKLLISELAAINQYTLHAGAIDFGGYKTLHDSIDKGAKEEMKNAQLLITGILKLGGKPELASVNGINFGKSIEEQLLNDLALQKKKICDYNEIIVLSKEAEYPEIAKLLEGIMLEQVKYQLWIELQIELIKKKELASYLQEQKAQLT